MPIPRIWAISPFEEHDQPAYFPRVVVSMKFLKFTIISFMNNSANDKRPPHHEVPMLHTKLRYISWKSLVIFLIYLKYIYLRNHINNSNYSVSPGNPNTRKQWQKHLSSMHSWFHHYFLVFGFPGETHTLLVRTLHTQSLKKTYS
jgi:hypothetical protein